MAPRQYQGHYAHSPREGATNEIPIEVVLNGRDAKNVRKNKDNKGRGGNMTFSIESNDYQRPSEKEGRPVLILCCCGLTLHQTQQITKFFSLLLMLCVFAFILGMALHFTKFKGDDQETEYESSFTLPPGNIKVGAYYYPWYGKDFHGGDGYMRKELSTVQLPELGEYDDTDPDIIYQHFLWSAQANVGLWVTSWWGDGTRSDRTTKDVIMQHKAIGQLDIALFYETTGRIEESEGFSLDRVIPDIKYMCQHYFSHPNYYRVDGRPVLFIYLTRMLAGLGILDEVIEQMRNAAAEEGYNIYIVGDHAFQSAPRDDPVDPPISILDAITTYDVYGSMFQPSPYATEKDIQEHSERCWEWKELANRNQVAFVPAVAPGYNDVGVRPEKENPPLARELSSDPTPGSLFRTSLQYARTLVDKRVDNLIMVNSFNEWHEDTQIEPARGETTDLPEDITHGIEYHGYGELYLDILREETLEL